MPRDDRASRPCRAVLIATFLMSTGLGWASSRVLEEQAQVELPGPSSQIVTDLALDGDRMLVVATRIEENPLGLWSHAAAYVFHRTPKNEWQHVTTLATEHAEWQEALGLRVALHGNVAAVDADELRIFEYLPSSGWTQVAAFPSSSDHYLYGGSVVVDASTIVAGGPRCAWKAYRKDAASQWTVIGSASDPTADQYCFASLDISGDVVVAGPSNWMTTPPSEVRIYASFASAPTATLVSPFGLDPYFGVQAVVHGDTIATVASRRPGAHIYRRDTSGAWQFVGSASSVDALVNERGYNLPILDVNEEFVVGAYPFDAQRGVAAGSVPVYQQGADGSYVEVARLLASDARTGLVLGTHIAVSKRRIAASAGYDSNGAVYVFELPEDLTQPDTMQDDFEAGELRGWMPLPGSMLAIESTDRSRVLQQTSRDGDAGAYVAGMDWTDQSIQADVRVLESDDKGWFGMVVRRSDPANYYYVTVRGSKLIQLRRMVDGTFEEIASAPFTFEGNRFYRLRLEAVGTWLRAYVDGKLLVEARDTTHEHGQAGIQMYKASVEYDNIVITPNPQVLIAADRFDSELERRWSTIDGHWYVAWDEATGRSYYHQAAAAETARAVTGVSVAEQIVQVRARAETFAAPNAWLGLIGRYQDGNNYYYVALGADGTVSLCKLEGGVTTVLATASLDISPSVWYTLRLELVRDALRVYVDDRFILQAHDTTFAEGRYGLATSGTVAKYADFVGWRP